MKYLADDMKRLDKLKRSYDAKINELDIMSEEEPLKKKNQTDEEYEKEVERFREKIKEKKDQIMKKYDPIYDEWLYAKNRYETIKKNGIDKYIYRLKHDLSKYKGEDYTNQNKITNITNFVLKNSISEAMGHRRNAIRRTFSNKNNKSNTRNKDVMNRVKASSNRWAAEQKARENANHKEYNRKTKNNTQKNRTTFKNGKPTIRTTPIMQNNHIRMMPIPAAGGRRSTKKKRSA